MPQLTDTQIKLVLKAIERMEGNLDGYIAQVEWNKTISLCDEAKVILKRAQEHMAKDKAYKHTSSRGQVWHLHKKERTKKNGGKEILYYFGKRRRDNGSLLPEGYRVTETSSGHPVLRRE